MKPRLAPVLVSRDSVLRTIVGLRPFRPTGFVVRREALGEKELVHNYGHGGAGVTLCWGTAQLAADLVPPTSGSVAVIGGGVVGLATARVLQARGHTVTIYARELSPNTTSDVAGGRWHPSSICDPQRASAAFLATMWQAARSSYAAFQRLPAVEYGIHSYPSYLCRDEPVPTDSVHFDSPIADLYPGLRDLPPAERPFPYAIVRTFSTMMIEPAIFLPALRRDFERDGGKIVVRCFTSAAELSSLPEAVIVNCTGLGAAALFGDTELYPIRGQLTLLRPQPEVTYVALPPDLYMFPRQDDLVLGGTTEHHDWSLEPDPATEARMLAAHARFFASLDREPTGP